MVGRRNGMRAIGLGGLAAATLAAVALGDTTVGSVGGVTYRSDSAPIGPPDQVVTDVSCPGNKHASGAGFLTVSTVAGPLNRSVPIDRGDGWAVMRTDEPGSPPGTSYLYVMCDSKGRSYRSSARMVPDGAAKTVKAKCPRSEHVSGGGAVLLGAPFYGEIGSTYPFDGPDRGAKPDDGWAVSASNVDHQPRKLKVTAVCAEERLAYKSTEFPESGGGFGGFSPPCGASRHLVGLGSRVSGDPSGAVLQNLFPADDKSDPDSLPDDIAIQDGSTSDTEATATVFAICR